MYKLSSRKYNKKLRKGFKVAIPPETIWPFWEIKSKTSSAKPKNWPKISRNKSGNACTAIKSLKLANSYPNIWSQSTKRLNSRYLSLHSENSDRYGKTLPVGPTEDYICIFGRSIAEIQKTLQPEFPSWQTQGIPRLRRAWKLEGEQTLRKQQ